MSCNAGTFGLDGDAHVRKCLQAYPDCHEPRTRTLGRDIRDLPPTNCTGMALTNWRNRIDYFQYMGCDSVTTSTDMSLSTRDNIAANPLWTRDDVSDAELEQRLNNYTTQDLAYSRQLAADGSAN